MGPQFVHIQCYSTKENAQGNSIDQVLGEAVRDPVYAAHVDDAELPALVYGSTVERLRELHSAMLEASATTVKVKGKERKRSIRKDRKTLMTVIASFPIPTLEMDDDKTGETRRRYEQWKALNVEFLKQKFGDQLKTVIEHTDEEYPHIHAYVLPDEISGCYALDLHPGELAKKSAAAVAIDDKQSKELIKKTANLAYQSAMRDFQSDYYREVGARSGLMRSGPKRQRLTRKEYQAEKADAADKAVLIEHINTEMKAIKSETRLLRSQSEKFDDVEDDIEAARAEISRDREKLNAERRKFQTQIGVVRDTLKSIFETMAEKLGVRLPSKISDAMLELQNAVDQIEQRNDDDPSLSM